MELILLDADRMEIGPADVNVDFDIGGENDFQIERSGDPDGGGIYVPGTELGGMIEYIQTTDDTAICRGHTWRGLLAQSVIEPEGDYRIVSGDLYVIMRQILSETLGGFFTGPPGLSGVEISSYQFNRYCTTLEGLTALLQSIGRRLSISARKPTPGLPVEVFLGAEEIARFEGEYDDDSGLTITFTDNRMGINHLICLGQGELSERMVRHLYVQEDGSIGEQKYFTGYEERTAVYDYSNADTETELLTGGRKRLRELAGGTGLSVKADEGIDLAIGDIVVGRKGSLLVESPVSGKTVTIEGGEVHITYKVEEV